MATEWFKKSRFARPGVEPDEILSLPHGCAIRVYDRTGLVFPETPGHRFTTAISAGVLEIYGSTADEAKAKALPALRDQLRDVLAAVEAAIGSHPATGSEAVASGEPASPQSTAPWCCWANNGRCEAPADFELKYEDPADPYAGTHACTEHVGDLLDAHGYTTVWPVDTKKHPAPGVASGTASADVDAAPQSTPAGPVSTTGRASLTDEEAVAESNAVERGGFCGAIDSVWCCTRPANHPPDEHIAVTGTKVCARWPVTPGESK